MILKNHLFSRSRGRQVLCAVLVACALLCSLAGTAAAQTVYFTPRALLASFFPRSERVSFRKFDLVGEQRARLEKRLGTTLPRAAYTIYVAQTGATIDGYAVLDEELGQHEPISFAVKLSPQGVVQRQEVMVYREHYGDEVRDERFRKQFVGKAATDPLRAGEDIVAVSGATISSRSMAVGVRRAVLLLDELVLKPQRAAASSVQAAPATTQTLALVR